jgi:hypothetical protein
MDSYHLTRWVDSPGLGAQLRVRKALVAMSVGWVTRGRLEREIGLTVREFDTVLRPLIEQGAIEVRKVEEALPATQGGVGLLESCSQALRLVGWRLGWRIRKRQAMVALERALTPNGMGGDASEGLLMEPPPPGTEAADAGMSSGSYLSQHVAPLLLRSVLVSCYAQVRSLQLREPHSARYQACLVALDRFWRRRSALARAVPLLTRAIAVGQGLRSGEHPSPDVHAAELEAATMQVLRKLVPACIGTSGRLTPRPGARADLFPPYVYVQVMRWAIERVCTVHATRLLLLQIGGDALVQQLPSLYRISGGPVGADSVAGATGGLAWWTMSR